MGSEDPGAAAPSLSAHYNASQVRADSWSRLKSATERLERSGRAGANTDRLRQQAAEILDLLEPIESYWAFPGRHVFQQLRRLLERGEAAVLARGVARIVRALMSGSYRRRTVSLGLHHGEEEEDEEELFEAGEEHARVRPYFEVMVVDDITAAQEQSLRQGLRDMRRGEDRFVYEAVVVPSFEDALIGAFFNHNIQAVVIRYGAGAFKSRQPVADSQALSEPRGRRETARRSWIRARTTPPSFAG